MPSYSVNCYFGPGYTPDPILVGTLQTTVATTGAALYSSSVPTADIEAILDSMVQNLLNAVVSAEGVTSIDLTRDGVTIANFLPGGSASTPVDPTDLPLTLYAGDDWTFTSTFKSYVGGPVVDLTGYTVGAKVTLNDNTTYTVSGTVNSPTTAGIFVIVIPHATTATFLNQTSGRIQIYVTDTFSHKQTVNVTQLIIKQP